MSSRSHRARGVAPRALAIAVVAGVAMSASGPAVAIHSRGPAVEITALKTPEELSASSPASTSQRPHIVVILTDDQRPETLRAMPRTRALLAQRGVTFPQAFAPTATCCPSRVSLLTGADAPRSGVWTNWLPYGGFEKFHRSGLESQTIATALSAAGYRTGLVGKYLNNYTSASVRSSETGDADYIPPGWSYWSAQVENPDASGVETDPYYDYTMMRRAAPDAPVSYTEYGRTASDYSTDVFAADAVSFIAESADDSPLFLLYSPRAPHKPMTPAPRHRDAVVPDLDVPGNTGTSQGKPSWVRNAQTPTLAKIRDAQRTQARMMLSVDESVEDIVEALDVKGVLRDTLIVFVSDNGLMWGEHGLFGRKNFPYTETMRVPLIMRWDARLPSGARDSRLVTMSDLAVTIVEAAGAQRPAGMLDGIDALGAQTRDGFLMAAWRNRGPAERRMPAYCGWRTRDFSYVRYAPTALSASVEELFDLRRDPGQTRNLIGSPDPAVAQVRVQLRAQARAACVPTPPQYRWAG